MQTDTFLVDVNQAFTGKTKREDMYQFNWTFETRELNLEQLLEHVQTGHSFTAPFAKVLRKGKLTPRLKANVIGVQLLTLDFDTEDERSTFDYLLRHGLVTLFGAALYTTDSHTPDKPRCRLLFVLEEELDVEEAELATKALMAELPHADVSAKDAGRVFYGSKDCEVKLLGNILPTEVLQTEIIAPYVAKMDAEKRAKQKKSQEARSQRQVDATTDQKTRYVNAVIQRVVSELAKATEGTGQRHEQLRTGSVRLFSLQKATWLTAAAAARLKDVEDELLDAARANGYVAKYGEEDTLRIIRSGADIATPAYEPHWRGYTKTPEVEPSEDDKKGTGKPPPPPPPLWPNEDTEALAVDFFGPAADELVIVDVEPRNEEVRPYFRHTCKSSRKKGAAINIYMDFTTFKPFTDHDWRNCQGCLDDYAYRKARQIETEAKRSQLTATWFETTEDWKRTRKKWNQWKRREKGTVAFTPFNQEDGRVCVIHSSTNEADNGQELPEGDKLEDFVLELCLTPAKTKNRASSGFGGKFQGSRGEGRAAEEKKKTGKRPDSYHLKSNASSARIAERAYKEPTDARGRGRKDLHCAESFLWLKAWENQELVEGKVFTLEERHEHSSDNEVIKAIFADELVQEAIKYNKEYKEANALSSLTSTSSLVVVDVKDDSQEVDATQQTLVFDTTKTSNMLEELPLPAHGPPQEDILDWYLETRRR